MKMISYKMKSHDIPRLTNIALCCLILCLAPVWSYEDAGDAVRTLYGAQRPATSKTIVVDSDMEFELPLQHYKKRRDVQAPNDNNSTLPIVKNFHLNDTHKQMMVHWVGEGSNVIICLARDAVMPNYQSFIKEQTSSVYISYDYGDTYETKTDLFKLANGSYSNLEKFYNHPKYNTHFVFADVKNKVIFVTSNHGRDVKRIELDFTPSDVQFHDYLPGTFAVLDKVDPTQKLWITEDFGDTFRMAQLFVKQFFWLQDEHNNFQLVVQRMEPTGLNLVMYSPSFLNEEKKLYDVNIKELYVRDGYLFTTKINSTTKNLELYLSYKFGKKLRCVFDTKEEYIKAFHIVDVSASRALVVASHSDMVSHLYVSEDVGGTDGKVHFTLSLEGIFSYFPNMTWQESWLNQVSKDAFVDIYKVEGISGIYIASRVINQPTDHNISPQHLGSMISFDHGSTWRLIRAPYFDNEGQQLSCQVEQNCSLHLSQKFTYLYPEVRTIGILSSKSAPGLIVATGVVGSNLKGHYGVYVSSDAGVTWHQSLKDLYFFNMGDHGGILTAAEYFTGSSKTRYLLYSTDEGEKWSKFEFNNEDIKLYSLMTEPGENTTVFTLFGSAPQLHQWIIFKIDLRSVFSYNCDKNDYKMWSPGQDENRSYIPCVMGRQMTYQRRMPHSNCYNGMNYDTPVQVKQCGCDAVDFECDFGFMRVGNPWYCIRNTSLENDPFEVPNWCEPGLYYNRTKGYRKIAGDVCEDGFEKHYLPDVIPCPVSEVQQFLLYAQRDRISRYDVLTKQNMELPIRNLKNVIAIDFDMRNNCVYWADIVSDMISRQCFNSNSSVEVLVSTDLASIEGLALDWISHTLYFVDGTRGKIELIRTDVNYSGRMRKTVLDNRNLKKPRGIAVHPTAGYLYWTDWATENPSISRANLDGSNIMALFRRPQVEWPNGITVDHIAERIYWVDAKQDYIASADLHGHKMTKLISGKPEVAHPFAIAVFKNMMFWDDWKNNAIYAADKDGRDTGVEVLHQSLPGLMDLKVYAHSLQEGTNACTNSTTCEFICVGAPKQGYSCLCPDGMNMLNGKCLCPGNVAPSPLPNATCPKMGNSCSPDHMACDNGAMCVPKGWRCDGEDDCGDNSDEKHCYSATCEANFHACDNGKCIPNYWKCDYEKDCVDGSDELNCPQHNCTSEQFKCRNGRCISERWKCDRENDCGDNSDEDNCEEPEPTQCKPDEYKCTSGNIVCIPLTWRCDGEIDCRDNSDEQDCKNNKCTSSQFSCGPPSNRCIYSSWVCDGDNDCIDGADEHNCTTYTPPKQRTPLAFNRTTDSCPTWMTKCRTRICIPIWWRCDGSDDCGDGSDEQDCEIIVPAPPTSTPRTDMPVYRCRQNEFHCSTGECILQSWVCDGSKDCKNGDDEENCDKSIRCTENQFRCRMDGSCIPRDKLCNRQEDCPDGSDEAICENVPTGVVAHSCLYGYFPCDDNSCHPLSDLCNGREDCLDGFDEKNCTNVKRIYQVLNINTTARKTKFNETNVDVMWRTPSGSNDKDLEYMTSYSRVGQDKWTNLTWTKNLIQRISNVLPYTDYNITVYTRIRGMDDAFPPAKYTVITTPEGVPSPPFNVTVQQCNSSHILINWQEPAHPNGIIESYDIVWSPPNPPIYMELNDNTTGFLLQVLFEHNQKYSFYVIAHNRNYRSEPSNVATLIFDSESDLDVIRNLTVKETTNHSVSLAWTYPKPVDGYRIFMYVPPMYPIYPEREVATNSAIIDGLAPGVKYIFKIMPFRKTFNGTFTTISAMTLGNPLPEVNRIVTSVVKDRGNAVKLSWDPPKDTRKASWTYGIYYGVDTEMLFEKPRLNTTNLTATVSNLHSCEHYYFSVALVGPYGLGPIRDPLVVTTSFNPRAPPKWPRVERDPIDPLAFYVRWLPSCSNAGNDIKYIIHVNETTRPNSKPSHYLIENQTDYEHRFATPYGAIYNITVSTNVPDAIPSDVIAYAAPPILPPYELRVSANLNKVFIARWSQRLHPKKMGAVSYEVLVSEGPSLNETTALRFNVTQPRFIFENTTDSSTYTFAVRTVSGQGYKSQLSESASVTVVEIKSADRVTSTEETSTSTLTTILVPVLLLLVIFGVVIGVLVVRHRRLQSSFTRFANSHYDTRSGAATFDDHGLEEEETPQIRGFSDDEPLVIA